MLKSKPICNIFIFILITAFTTINAHNQLIKVACVGNSVTYGYLLTDRDQKSYPAQLQKSLGDEYEVRNFGKSGATLLSKGHRPYVDQEEYQAALQYCPDVVVIALALNDTDPRNWPNYRDQFFKDYIRLIDSFRQQNPSVKIWICKMSPIRHDHPRFISGTRDWYHQIQSEIERIAEYANTGLIDLETPLLIRPDLFTDSLHPNAEGASIIAQTVYSALTGNYGGLAMPAIYSDNMVLQRNKDLTIRGRADRGETITIEIASKRYETATTAEGNWEITIDPLMLGQTYVIRISSPRKTIEYKNVQVGDVWLCSGQSNMAYELNQDADYQNVKDYLNNNQIYIYDMKPRWQTYAVSWDKEVLDSLNRLDYFSTQGWQKCDTQTAPSFSAIAYYFAKVLSDSLDIPIGIIHNAVGGSPIESWIDRRTLQNEFPQILTNWTDNDFIQDWVRSRASLNIKQADNKNQRHSYEPAYLFESAILPLASYPITGLVWYQGESNAHNSDIYKKLFSLFSDSWRNCWADSLLPIYYVQLSSIDRPSWTWFRDTQRKLMEEIPNVYMTVSSDRGDSLDVHPRYKKDIGERLARWALNKQYHKTDIVPSGPLFKSVHFLNDTAYVHFNYAQDLKPSDGNTIQGFELAEIDGLFYPAKALPKDGMLKVFSDSLHSPKYIRYAWQAFTRANLVNGAGLPASTFRNE